MPTPIVESAKTAGYSVTPHPLGKPDGPGLWHHKGLELPPYIQNVAQGILKTTKDKSKAIQIAIGRIEDWASGKGNVSDEVKAAAAAAIAQLHAKAAAVKSKVMESQGWDEAAFQRAVDGAQANLEMLERLGLPPVGAGARFDTLLVEAGAFAENLHPRGGKGTAAGGKFVAAGSTGTPTRGVQRRVGARVDGKFGDQTKAKVEAFQKAHGLTVDGIVGRQTVAALRGRKDAKRVAVGGLSSADIAYLTGHVRGNGRQSQTQTTTPEGALKTTTRTPLADGKTKVTTSLVEAVAPPAFLDRVKGLHMGETARLPDGSAVKHHATEDGRKVYTAGRPSRYGSEGVSWGESHRTAEDATAAALTRSAASSDPDSLGGTTRFSRYRPVKVNGRPAMFAGVNEHAQPMVKVSSQRILTQDAAMTDLDSGAQICAWPDVDAAPLLESSPPPTSRGRLVEGVFDDALHPRDGHGEFARGGVVRPKADGRA